MGLWESDVAAESFESWDPQGGVVGVEFEELGYDALVEGPAVDCCCWVVINEGGGLGMMGVRTAEVFL